MQSSGDPIHPTLICWIITLGAMLKSYNKL